MNQSTFLKQTRAGLFAAAFLGLSGLAAAVGPAADTASAPASEALRARIVDMIGDAACDGQGQCHVAGLGRRPCGGAESWLPWSTKTTDSRVLQDAVVELAKARIGENQAAGLLSDCQVRPDPSAVCRPRASDGKKTCQLGQGGITSPI